MDINTKRLRETAHDKVYKWTKQILFIKLSAFEKSPTGKITTEQLLSLVNYWPRTTNILKIKIPATSDFFEKLHSLSPAERSGQGHSFVYLNWELIAVHIKKWSLDRTVWKEDTTTKWKLAVTLVDKGFVTAPRLCRQVTTVDPLQEL